MTWLAFGAHSHGLPKLSWELSEDFCEAEKRERAQSPPDVRLGEGASGVMKARGPEKNLVRGESGNGGTGQGFKKCSCGLRLLDHLKACLWTLLIRLSSSTTDFVNHSCNRITEKTNIIPLLPLNEHLYKLGRLSCTSREAWKITQLTGS